MVRVDENTVIYETGEQEQDAAWTRLIDEGHNPHHWMYMDTFRQANGFMQHQFKNIRTRKYISV